MNSTTRQLTRRSTPARRTVTAVMAVGVGMAGLTACGTGSAGPEAGGVSVEDLQALEEELTSLDERVGLLEEGGGGDSPADDSDAFFGDAAAMVGQQVTVSGGISELPVTTDQGTAFTIAGNGGDPVAVVSAGSAPQLQQDDVVRVTGTVQQLQRDSFERDFGVAADELFEDPDAWFADRGGSVAISATEVEVLQEQAAG